MCDEDYTNERVYGVLGVRMNIKEARELKDSVCFCCNPDGDAISNNCICEKKDIAKGFIEGHESREAEVEELKKEIKELRKSDDIYGLVVQKDKIERLE